jgi:hypothetical protein
MSKMYDRRVEIIVDGVTVISPREGMQFKMTFDVLVDFGAFNSFCELVLTNMTQATMNLFKRDSEIIVRAGYADSIDVIFKGFIKNFIPDRDGPDTLFRVISRSGTKVDGREPVNVALGKDAKLPDIIDAVVNAMGLPSVYDPSQFDDVKPYPRGYTMSADPERQLNNLATRHGFDWLVENGRVIILTKAATRQSPPRTISQFNGMEGRPEITEVGADVTVRLDPSMKVGEVFIIESKYKSFEFSNLYFQDIPETHGTGDYKSIRLTHVGDTWGDVWSTKVCTSKVAPSIVFFYNVKVKQGVDMNNKNTEMMRLVFGELVKEISTSIPGHVIAFDPLTQLAQVQIGVVGVKRDETTFDRPPLIEVPVTFIGDSEFIVEHQIVEGTEGAIFFSQRCIDGWVNTGGIAENPIMRFHDINDAHFSPGLRSQPNAITDFKNDGIRLRNKSGDSYMWLKKDGTAEFKVTKLKVLGAIESTGDMIAAGVSVVNHAHKYVDSKGSAATAVTSNTEAPT